MATSAIRNTANRMLKKIFCAVFFVFAGVHSADAGAESLDEITAVIERHNATLREAQNVADWNEADAARRDAFKKTLTKISVDDFLDQLDDDQLNEFFEILHHYTVDTEDDYGLKIFRAAFLELLSRNLVDDVDVGQYGQALYLYNDWPALLALSDQWPNADLRSPPQPAGPAPSKHEREIWKSNVQGDTLLRRGIDMSAFTGVVFVATNKCFFSQTAVEAIGEDPALVRLFQSHALLLTPPSEILPDSSLSEWSLNSLQNEPAVVASRSDWPDVPVWSAPNFYFFKEGQPVKWVRGWPLKKTPQRLKALEDGFREIGLSEN